MNSCSGASDREQADRHAQHGARFLEMPAGEQIARADREHDEAGGEVGGVEHVREAIGEARIEDRSPTSRADRRCRRASRGRSACASSCWRTESRTRTSRCRSRRRPPTARAASGGTRLPAEQQDAEEGRLQEKRGQHLVADQRADDVAGDHREAAPVGAELVGQHDARTRRPSRTRPRRSWSRTAPAGGSARGRSHSQRTSSVAI